MSSAPAESTLPAAIGAIASLLAEGLSDDDLDLLSAVFTQLGDSLATISILRSRNTQPPAPGGCSSNGKPLRTPESSPPQ